MQAQPLLRSPLAATLHLPGRAGDQDPSQPQHGHAARARSRAQPDLRLRCGGVGLPLTPPPLLFQQVKSIERFLCRLEFHASKVRSGDQGHRGATSGQHWDGRAVSCPALHRSSGLSLQIDELYEAYCIQRRLRDGAHNMVKAYSTGSPGSREARESLAEASKGYKEYTEVRRLPGVG